MLALMASAGAKQQATVTQPPPPERTSAQDVGAAPDAASPAIVEHKPVNASMPSSDQATPTADVATDTSAEPPVRVDPIRGVLFRIFPPPPTLLPAELMVPASGKAEGGIEASTTATPTDAAAPAVMADPATAPPPSYLLGTIHFGSADEQGIDYGILETALASVATFVNEADLDEAWNAAYDDYRWLPPAQPLSALVGKRNYSIARSLLPGVRGQDLIRMKPWSVLALLEARGESGGDTTMDARLQRIAAASGKRVVHLETLEQQLQALDCVPAKEHALVLDERLRAPWILRDESAAAMRYYRSRNLEAWLSDIDKMDGLSPDGKAIEQRSRHCLLEDRNARWIGQLETLFQDGASFVAVGAIHLVGPQGLLASLHRDGYRIEEVPL